MEILAHASRLGRRSPASKNRKLVGAVVAIFAAAQILWAGALVWLAALVFF